MKFPSILVARQRTTHVLYLLSISLLQNIANTLFDTIGEIKWSLLYCFRFEMILNSWQLSQTCHQRERTSLWDGLRLPSNSTLKIIRRQLLYAVKLEGSFYMCIKFQSKVPTQPTLSYFWLTHVCKPQVFYRFYCMTLFYSKTRRLMIKHCTC